MGCQVEIIREKVSDVMLEMISQDLPLLSRLYTGVCLSSLNQSTSLTASPGMLLVILHGSDTELSIMEVI